MSRPTTNTEAAIDDVIASAAAVVDDALAADGVPPRRVTAKDVPHPVHRCPPARPPSPTVPEQPTERVPVVSLAMLARHAAQLDVQTPSLSAFEVPGRDVIPRAVHDAPTRRAADPYPRWILGVTALIATVAAVAAITMRLVQDEPSGAAPPAAATEVPDVDAGMISPRRRRMVGDPDR
jgi:hypothetical protein